MAQEITLAGITNVNVPLLDSQLKAAAPTDCYGIKVNIVGGIPQEVFLIVSDTIAANLLTTLRNIAAAHDPNAKTPEQTAVAQGKLDIVALLNSADQALTDLAAKKATFNSAPTLGNAAPLLLEAVNDLVGVIKVLKYVVKQIPQ